jgi:hypothetical protein
MLQKIEKQNFKWYYIIFDPQFTSCLHVKSFLVTPKKKDKYLSIQLEVGQIWTTGAS